MFAALAASGFAGIPKPPGDDKIAANAESSSAGASSTSGIQRRRSQRLAKQVATSTSSENLHSGLEEGTTSASSSALNALGTEPAPLDPTPTTLATEPTPSETVVESEQLHPEFTDDEDEIDAEVFDDDVDPDNPMSEKTITLSVVEGMSLIL